MTIGTKESLFATTERTNDTVPWNGTEYHLRSMNEGEKGRLDAKIADAEPADGRKLMIIAHLCDDQGHLLLTEDDMAKLNEVNAKLSERLIRASMKLSGYSDNDIEEQVGNSPETTEN